MVKQKDEINEDVASRIKKHRLEIESLKNKIKEEETKMRDCKSQLDCEHKWKVDISFGGPDIETCEKCGVVHYC